MNKNTIKDPVSYDDYIYTVDLAEQFALNTITFDELLEVVPASIDLAKFIRFSKECLGEETAAKVAANFIEHYYSRLIENYCIHGIKDLKKLLSLKEVFFLIDHVEIEKLVEGKEIDITEEINYALRPVKNSIKEILKEKAFGNSKHRISVMIKPYNSLFISQIYLKSNPGYISPTGEIYPITQEFIDENLKEIYSLEVFPARNPIEKFVFNSFKEKIQSEEEPNL